MHRVQFSDPKWQWIAMLFLSLIWGSSFILMKKGLESYSYTQVAAFRLFFSFLFMLPLSIKNYRIITRENIDSLLVVGLVGFAIPAFLFTKAQTQINSSLAGMLNSLTPLFTLIIGLIFYKSKVKGMNVLGIIIGLIGALGLIWNRDIKILEGINLYAVFIVIATICYGINVNVLKYKLSNLTPVEITSVSFLFVGPIGGIYLLFTDFSGVTQTDHYILNLIYIAILALFSSVIAIIIFNALIRYTTAIFAASVTYIIPLFAILWGLFDGEQITLFQLMWMIVILIGVYLVNKK